METEHYSDLDKVLEQCTWVSMYWEHGEKYLCFNKKSGIIFSGHDSSAKLDKYNTIIKGESSEEIYSFYLNEIVCSKERAWVNNERDGSFSHSRHRLMSQRYISHGYKVKRELKENQPELFI